MLGRRVGDLLEARGAREGQGVGRALLRRLRRPQEQQQRAQPAEAPGRRLHGERLGLAPGVALATAALDVEAGLAAREAERHLALAVAALVGPAAHRQVLPGVHHQLLAHLAARPVEEAVLGDAPDELPPGARELGAHAHLAGPQALDHQVAVEGERDAGIGGGQLRAGLGPRRAGGGVLLGVRRQRAREHEAADEQTVTHGRLLRAQGYRRVTARISRARADRSGRCPGSPAAGSARPDPSARAGTPSGRGSRRPTA